MKHAIVSEVGGTRFPFIVKVGSTLRAANVHPDTTLFTSFDELQQRVVPLDAAHDYEVVSGRISRARTVATRRGACSAARSASPTHRGSGRRHPTSSFSNGKRAPSS